MVYYINIFEDECGYLIEGMLHYSQQQATDDAAFMLYPRESVELTQTYKHTVCVSGKKAEVLDLTSGIQHAQNEIYEDILGCAALANITSIDMISRSAIDDCKAFNRDIERKVVQMEEFRGKYASR